MQSPKTSQQSSNDDKKEVDYAMDTDDDAVGSTTSNYGVPAWEDDDIIDEVRNEYDRIGLISSGVDISDIPHHANNNSNNVSNNDNSKPPLRKRRKLNSGKTAKKPKIPLFTWEENYNPLVGFLLIIFCDVVFLTFV